MKAAKLTNGSGGPSGIDSEGWQRFLCSRHFKTASSDLYIQNAIALFIRKLATAPVPHSSIAPFLASRLIPLDKSPGIRAIGVGEVLRRISGKVLTMVLRQDITACTAPLQTCGGLQGGVEASIHALRTIYATNALIILPRWCICSIVLGVAHSRQSFYKEKLSKILLTIFLVQNHWRERCTGDQRCEGRFLYIYHPVIILPLLVRSLGVIHLLECLRLLSPFDGACGCNTLISTIGRFLQNLPAPNLGYIPSPPRSLAD